MADDRNEEEEAEKERLRNIAKADQGSSLIQDFLPTLWYGLFQKLKQSGFTEPQSMELLKAYVLGMSAGKIVP